MISIAKNSVQLKGNIGKNIELQEFESGNKKATVSLASNIAYKTADGDTKRHTEWFNLVAWGKLAQQMAESLRKGEEIAIEGRLSNRTYTDKQGNLKYITEIIVNEFHKMEKSVT
jgi:single-strand DNA-binding protein